MTKRANQWIEYRYQTETASAPGEVKAALVMWYPPSFETGPCCALCGRPLTPPCLLHKFDLVHPTGIRIMVELHTCPDCRWRGRAWANRARIIGAFWVGVRWQLDSRN